jgi:uncharacterized phage protein (TIGR02216 family)|tara:strand:+ start:813 stop:983 length:171 start_codon:yes stop_codon:yes gene_type:complete
MRLAFGKMMMSPANFWGMSLPEFFLATEGFVEFNGNSKAEPLGRDELNNLMERYPD